MPSRADGARADQMNGVRPTWSLNPVHDRGGRRLDQELRDRKTIGEQHQHEYQHVPEAESVERRGHPPRRMNRKRIERTRYAYQALAMERREVGHEEQRG